jgi:hypothetical protein
VEEVVKERGASKKQYNADAWYRADFSFWQRMCSQRSASTLGHTMFEFSLVD